jgi:hypothetical protein
MEATMWGGAITRLQLQQTISRLRKLDELPEVPSENLAVPEVDQTRHLREFEIFTRTIKGSDDTAGNDQWQIQ